MLFSLLKAYARFALKIYCRKIVINSPEWLLAKGPLLLAANHPNSFLDGIILTTLFKNDIYTLARGDAFRNRKHEKLLRWLHLLPVYRTSEGVQNLEHNYATFNACRQIFDQEGIVLIFSEGGCKNEWHLRPLKKGTARLATSAWLQEVAVTVVPVGLNYSSFRNFGKNVVIHFGAPIDKNTVMAHHSDGKMFMAFNEQLQEQLATLVYQIPKQDKVMLRHKLSAPQPLLKKVLLVIPAIAGAILHSPLYFPLKAINGFYFNNDHFDSTLVGLVVLTYPFYTLLLVVLTGLLWSWSAAAALIVLLPVTAWCCVQLKKQFN